MSCSECAYAELAQATAPRLTKLQPGMPRFARLMQAPQPRGYVSQPQQYQMVEGLEDWQLGLLVAGGVLLVGVGGWFAYKKLM